MGSETGHGELKGSEARHRKGSIGTTLLGQVLLEETFRKIHGGKYFGVFASNFVDAGFDVLYGIKIFDCRLVNGAKIHYWSP